MMLPSLQVCFFVIGHEWGTTSAYDYLFLLFRAFGDFALTDPFFGRHYSLTPTLRRLHSAAI